MERESYSMYSETKPKNIKLVFLKHLQYWYLYLIGGVLSLAVAYFYLVYATPQYRISTTLLIKDEKNSSGSSEGNTFNDIGFINAVKSIDNEMVMLQSSYLMQKALFELSLLTSIYIEGQIKDKEIYGADVPIKVIVNSMKQGAFEKKIAIKILDNIRFELEEGQERTVYKFGQQIQKSYADFNIVLSSPELSSIYNDQTLIVKFNDLQALVGEYVENLSVSPYNDKSSVVVVTITDPVPERGVNIINKLIEVYNKDAMDDKNLIAANTINFIDERLGYLTAELSDVEKGVEQFKQHNELADVSSQTLQYMKESSDYNKQIADLNIQNDVLESIEKYLSKQQSSQYKLVPSSLNIKDPTLLSLISKFNELQLDRERILRTAHSANPIVLSLNEQLANLRIDILENLQNIKSALSVTKRNLLVKSNQFDSRIEQVPVVERQLLEITRQQEIKESLYQYLLQKREEAAISLAANISNSRLIDPAGASNYPISPNKAIIYIAALMVGLGLPFAYIFINLSFNEKVQSMVEVKQTTGVPILGEVSHHNEKHNLVVTGDSRTPVAELFRLMRSNLNFVNFGKNNKVLLITSCVKGEGKTFFSINMAASLALMGKKVVVLDFDLRAPRLAHALGLPNNLGITNYLDNRKTPLEEIIFPSTDVRNLFFIGSGPIPDNPAELMLHEDVEILISTLREQFDYILIDSAPVGQVSDAFALSHLVDSSVFIVRYDYTSRSHLEAIDEIHRLQKLNNMMVVLNDTRNGSSYGYNVPKKKQLVV
ncbi:GumC family protein [Pontibacter harenae]|uniref:GumC family protein n=1 Tax=Pontibacter harenae TaxID=2894083 RepID=UPI001E637640|nr:tyrosine-protein kinase [Pontibacter harenae]MCC9167203.1 polysaccharide biosynthesis tyrosine autokinase [Pontibacter harenae]